MANNNSPGFLTIVGQEALSVIRENIVLAKRVNSNFEELTATQGETLKIPAGGSFIANDKSIGGDVTVQDASLSMVNLTLNKHKEATFIIDDIEKAKTKLNLFDANQKAAVKAIANAVETDLFGLVSSFSTEIGTAGTDLTDPTTKLAMKTLDDESVDANDRTLVVSSKDKSALLGIDRFTEVNKYGANTSIATGELGQIYGFQTFMSQLTPVVAGSPDTTKNVAFHKDAMALAVRPLPIEANSPNIQQTVVTDPESGLSVRVTMWYNGAKLGWQTTIDLLYGVKLVRDTFGVRVLS